MCLPQFLSASPDPLKTFRLLTFSLSQFLSQTTKLEITLLHMETFLSAIWVILPVDPYLS